MPPRLHSREFNNAQRTFAVCMPPPLTHASSAMRVSAQIPPHREYSTEPASVAALAIVLTGTGFACDGTSRQKLCGGVAFFVPARTPIIYTSTGSDRLWLCLARSNLNHGGVEDSEDS